MPRSLLFVCCALLFVPALGQHHSFRRYSVENGLSNNLVSCCIQDSKGFIWVGTPDGLNRFDGYAFKVFRSNRSDKHSIGNGNIRTLCADTGGRVWAGTDKGLFHFNPETEIFHFLAKSAPVTISDVKMDKHGVLWFIAAATLNRFDTKTEQLFSYSAEKYFKASALCFAGDQLWVSSSEGVLKKYNTATDSFTDFYVFKEAKEPDENRWIDKLYATSDGDILIGTATHGAKIFYTKKEQFGDILVYNEDRTTAFAKHFVEVGKDEYWIGTESAGIYIYNKQMGVVNHIVKKYNDPYALSDNSVNTFCKDNRGGIWVGTNYGGLNYYSGKPDVFTKYFPKSGENSLSGNVVKEIQGDNRGDLWIGTDDAGLNKLETATGKFYHYKPDGKKGSIAYHNIQGMLIDGEDLWMGTYVHGLDILDTRTGKVKIHYPAGKDTNALKSDFVVNIHRSADGQIFLATPHGAYIYNRTRKDFSLVKGLPAIWYTFLYKDKTGTLWAGMVENGIRTVNLSTGTTGLYQHNRNDAKTVCSGRINAVFCDTRGVLWFGTGGGLCCFNSETNSFTRYTVEQGLPSDIVLSIIEDNYRKLWVSTSLGLISLSLDNGNLKTYTKEKGILNDQFSANSVFKDSSGRLYFGSVEGLISFDPKALTDTDFDPPLYLTGFQVFNKELSIGTGDSPLYKSITWTDELVLNHRQSSFSIDFAALNYTSPEVTEYAYKMEGNDNDWTYLKENRKIYFTNLSPGNYEFKVKARTGEGPWEGTERSIRIRILAPWWLSREGFFIYVIALGFSIVLLVRNYNRKVQRRNRIKMEQMQMARAKEAYDDKLNFFTNVAHEIKTPLTLIKGPLEQVINTIGDVPEVAQSLRIIDRNTNRLVELANQFLDFRQTEIKGFSLSFAKTNISELLLDLYESFKPLTVKRGLTYTICCPPGPVFAWIDVDAFNKISSNLFSNAIKYADTTVCVNFIGMDQSGNVFIVDISNDGFLIPDAMSERIFDPFFRLKETKKHGGAGVGLALSLTLAKLHNGSLALKKVDKRFNTFSLTLPVQQDSVL